MLCQPSGQHLLSFNDKNAIQWPRWARETALLPQMENGALRFSNKMGALQFLFSIKCFQPPRYKNLMSVDFHLGEGVFEKWNSWNRWACRRCWNSKGNKFVSILRTQHQAYYNVTTDRLYLKLLCKFWDWEKEVASYTSHNGLHVCPSQY